MLWMGANWWYKVWECGANQSSYVLFLLWHCFIVYHIPTSINCTPLFSKIRVILGGAQIISEKTQCSELNIVPQFQVAITRSAVKFCGKQKSIFRIRVGSAAGPASVILPTISYAAFFSTRELSVTLKAFPLGAHLLFCCINDLLFALCSASNRQLWLKSSWLVQDKM